MKLNWTVYFLSYKWTWEESIFNMYYVIVWFYIIRDNSLWSNDII